MRIVVFGANGPTGRLLTAQAVERGHEVAAVTRRPAGFPLVQDCLPREVRAGRERDLPIHLFARKRPGSDNAIDFIAD